jgi:hypothetical protein
MSSSADGEMWTFYLSSFVVVVVLVVCNGGSGAGRLVVPLQ